MGKAKTILGVLIFIILNHLSIIACSQSAPADSLAVSVKQASSLSPLAVTGFVETYYCYDFSQPDTHERPGFLYNYKRVNEFNLNMALLKLSYDDGKGRGNIGIMAGNYPEYNLAAEQSLIRNIYEATAGFKIGKRFWLDAGIFPSHIGAESVISFDNLTLTRSLSAENTPYYEAGVKLTFEASPSVSVTALVVNGWQNVRENNNGKAIGAQVQYKLSERILINYSNFLGNEKPDSASQTRFFQDIYTIAALNDKIKFIGSMDLGIEEKPRNENGSYFWWNPTLSLQYMLTDKFGIAARWENYHDKYGVIVKVAPDNGFQTTGYSLNMSYTPIKQILWRLEARVLNSKQPIFKDSSGNSTSTNVAFTTSLSFKFNRN